MNNMNVLVSSAGRLELIACIREALRTNGLPGRVYAVDCSATAPAMRLADESRLVPGAASSRGNSGRLFTTQRLFNDSIVTQEWQ